MPASPEQMRLLKNAFDQFAAGRAGYEETDEFLTVVFRFARNGGCLDEMKGALDEVYGKPNRLAETRMEAFGDLVGGYAPSGGKRVSSTKR